MKNKGFTLIELLATVVILGIIMVIAIPNVTGILQKNKAKSYYEDAKKLVTLAEYKMRGDSSVAKPTGNKCLVMNLYYLDNSEFDNAPNGGEYDKTGSFVVIKRVTVGGNDSYTYHVRLLEEVSAGSYTGIDFMESSNLYKDVDLGEIRSVSASDRFTVKTKNITGSDLTLAQLKSKFSVLGVDCSGGIIEGYAIAS